MEALFERRHAMPQIQREASGPVMRGGRGPASVQRRPRRVGRFTLLFQARKTVHLVQAVLADRRVPVLRKALFLWALVMLALALLVPDTGSALASMVVPVLGPLIDLPVDGLIDWSVAIALAPSLLRLLPAEIVAEHQAAIFG
jgi:hypothetical protein